MNDFQKMLEGVISSIPMKDAMKPLNLSDEKAAKCKDLKRQSSPARRALVSISCMAVRRARVRHR
jgi:hypothetical protein